MCMYVYVRVCIHIYIYIYISKMAPKFQFERFIDFYKFLNDFWTIWGQFLIRRASGPWRVRPRELRLSLQLLRFFVS